MRVLVAEDDGALRDVLQRGLREAGYVVDTVADGEAASVALRHNDYEVAVLDWRMPKRSGVEVTMLARRGGVVTPILMLTARDALSDRVEGLQSGADDYLVKPFEFAELVARLHALQRRPALRFAQAISCGDLEFDPGTRELHGPRGPITLTAIEGSLVELLLRRSPSVVTRSMIASQVWDDRADVVGSNTVEVHVARLRAKLKGCAARIETVRGVGYRIVAG
jgi:DNA-binding response OmpR family regulator